MIYIGFGIFALLIIIVLVLTDKFAPSSALMSNFNESTYEKLILFLSIATVASISYGIYYEITYQPPFLDITVAGENYTVFGDIGEIGYYSAKLVYKDEKSTISLVLWEELELHQAEIIVKNPSGKEVLWETQFSPLEQSKISALKEKHQIQEIYPLAPFTFKEKGKVKIYIINGEKVVKSFKLEVRERG